MRRAVHAGSWYSDKPELFDQIHCWFEECSQKNRRLYSQVKAVICPHAGYKFSGHIAAESYNQLLPIGPNISRIFVLGTSHFYPSKKCLVSSASFLETPIGNLNVDIDVCANLCENKNFFEFCPQNVDHKEHSLELQYPMLSYLLNRSNSNAKIVPIIVSSLNNESFYQAAKIIMPYFVDQESLFVVSTDFSHYGRSFNFFPFGFCKETDSKIVQLDEKWINVIGEFDPVKLDYFYENYYNTICGIYPIKLLVRIISLINNKKENMALYRLQKLAYSRSSIISDSISNSVGYLAALVYLYQPDNF